MIDPIEAAIAAATSGLEAHSTRMRVISENLANAESTAATPGANPYTRKLVTFEDEMDQASGADLVKVAAIGYDRSPYRVEYDPGNPAADANGFVKLPNVNLISEMADMREANRSYSANIQVVKQARELFTMTVDLMRNN
ncbi:flagellar basal body rod protein FlgC [uncultured Methylovirgula sp.]|uniref:flagellar basal body rod protein FlgC n=1 Tax=uncultured Methylovirgula sp. TaxID=1285960 RepID=UPI0026366043|nr:flagellar basal body rod protein FlgC [uncultured Methylovirgula sp.]